MRQLPFVVLVSDEKLRLQCLIWRVVWVYRLVLSRHCAPPLFADKVGGKGKANNLVETQVSSITPSLLRQEIFSRLRCNISKAFVIKL